MDWDLLDFHPLAKVKPSKVDQAARIRFLSDEEERRLREALDAREARIRAARMSGNAWRRTRGYAERAEIEVDAFADYLKPLVLLALNTGLRRGELLQLTWVDIDLERRMLTVRGEGAKSGRTRYVPLNVEALAVLRGWKGNAGLEAGTAFTRHGADLASVRKSWAGLLEAAKIEHFRFHDLRHSFASKLVMRNVSINTVRELLGHSDLKMTMRYAHLSPDHKHAAVERLMEVA